MDAKFFRKYADLITEAEQSYVLDEGWFGKMLDKLNWDSPEAQRAGDNQEKEFRTRWAELAPRARAGDPEAQKEIEQLRQEIEFYKTGSRTH